jgi:hypothetical protein
LDKALTEGLVGRSRIGPLTTAVKQYARMLGEEAKSLPPERYHLSKPELYAYIEAHAPETLGPRALANLKDNLRWLLDLGVTQKWLIPPVGPVIPWNNQQWRLYGKRPRRPLPPDQIAIDYSPYCLLLPLTPRTKPRTPAQQKVVDRMRQGRQCLPEPVRQDMEAYLQWCTHAYAPGRPAAIKKRLASHRRVRAIICAVGGYAVHVAGMPLSEVSLSSLSDPSLVGAFVGWWINERRGRATASIPRILQSLLTIAKYWVKNSDHAEGILSISESLGDEISTVWDKEASLMELRDLERVGLSCYPFTEERLRSSDYNRRVYNHVKNPERYPPPNKQRQNAFSKIVGMLQMSLIIRLLVRLPMRQRNIREMKLDHNLKRTAEGWEIHFRETELKVGFRHGVANEYRHPFPKDLEPLLDESHGSVAE